MYASQDLPPTHGYRERDLGPRDFDNQPSSERLGPAKRLAVAKKPRSLGRRVVRAMSRFVITLLLGVGGTLAWQSHGNEAREMLRTYVPSLAAMLPVSTAGPSASARGAEAAQQQQLEHITRDLVVVRRSLENLAAKQEQIAFHLQLSRSAPSWAAPILPDPAQPPAKSPISRPAPAAPAPTRSAQQPVVLR